MVSQKIGKMAAIVAVITLLAAPLLTSAKTFDWIGGQIRRKVRLCTPGPSPVCFGLSFMKKGYPLAIVLDTINEVPVGVTLKVVGSSNVNNPLSMGTLRTQPGQCSEKDFVLGWGASRSIPVIGIRVIATIFKVCGAP